MKKYLAVAVMLVLILLTLGVQASAENDFSQTRATDLSTYSVPSASSVPFGSSAPFAPSASSFASVPSVPSASSFASIPSVPTASSVSMETKAIEKDAEVPYISCTNGKPGKITSMKFLWGDNRKKTKSASAVMGTSTDFTMMWSFKQKNGYTVELHISSSDESIAKVFLMESNRMFLETYKPGKCVITCEDAFSGKKCTLKVKVTVGINEINIPGSTYNLLIGDTLDIRNICTVEPSVAASQPVKITSSNKKIVSIDRNGVAKAVKPGSVTVTAASGGNKSICDTCTINVVESLPEDARVYRFFGIGNIAYSESLDFCLTNVLQMGKVYQSLSYNGVPMDISNVHTYRDVSGTQLKEVLQSMTECGADEDDVTIFYFCGHGSSGAIQKYRGALCCIDGTVVTVDEVQQYLDRIPGTVVVFLDCCYSGQFIERKNTTSPLQSSSPSPLLPSSLSSSVSSSLSSPLPSALPSSGKNASALFHQAWVKAFSRPGRSSKSLTESPYSQKYKILTSSHPMQSSYGGYPMGAFSYALAVGMGQSPGNAYARKLLADTNRDTCITLQELYIYAENFVRQHLRQSSLTQDVMVWPENDSFIVFAQESKHVR